jgi:hypothetical protein
MLSIINTHTHGYKNRMVLTGNGKTITSTQDQPFTSVRQLIGKFSVGSNSCLTKRSIFCFGITEIRGLRLNKPITSFTLFGR